MKKLKKKTNMTADISRFILALAIDGRVNWNQIHHKVSEKFGGVKFNRSQWKRIKKLSEHKDPLGELDRLEKARAVWANGHKVLKHVMPAGHRLLKQTSLERVASASLTSVSTEKITADTRNGTPGRIKNVEAESADHPSFDLNHTDEMRLWDSLEAIIADTIGGSEIRDVMTSRGVQLDHNDFAVLRDVADVALNFGNVSHASEEYSRALSELISRIRDSKV